MKGFSHDSRPLALAAWFALVCGVAAWLWPIGFGGRMPVGGDVTQFSLGLMAVLARSLRSWRLPVWNELWGYGFPGLAESQMGVYYPPHWVFYGLLPLEWAYTASLVFHTMLGAAGTYWAARRFGVTPAGSALAGFAWTASGFFVIHLPHQWGYTVASWMPWAWGLAWIVGQGRGGSRAWFFLTLVLVLQVLPGHFQLAFYTEVAAVLLCLSGRPWPRGFRRGPLRVALALSAMIPLAALQLWPTFRLAQLSASRRDFGYLSGFASTPLHLVNYLAPGLFRWSPLWRPLVWDPLHTSPEENLGYVGLVPLLLAVGALVHGARRSAEVRALGVVALATTLFSLGPYVPGFAWLSQLPGFSFFRAPARWSVAAGLALCLLAGVGFDTWREWTRPGRWIVGFCGFALLVITLVLGGVELALESTEGPGWPAVAQCFQKGLNLLPWSRVEAGTRGARPPRTGEQPEPTFETLMAIARQPQDDLRVQVSLARQGVAWQDRPVRTFARSRLAIYRGDLWETGVLLAALLTTAALVGRPRLVATAFVFLTAADLLALGRHRAYDLGPIRPLEAQSPLLVRLPRSERTADPSRNLPMVAASAPISAYRTLDLPCMSGLTALALADPGGPGGAIAVLEALRASGSAVRIFDPFETVVGSRADPGWPGWDRRDRVHDPALAGWLYGADWVARQDPRASTFSLYHPPGLAAQAWLVPLTGEAVATILKTQQPGPGAVLAGLREATPLQVRRGRPERVEVRVQAPATGIVVVSQLAHPDWRAWWEGPSGTRPARILPAFGSPGELGWQAVEMPGPGAWTLRMEYDSRDVRVGLGVSAVSGVILVLCYGLAGRFASHSQGDPT